MRRFEGVEDQKLTVVLAQKGMTIYFTKKHIADLRAVIDAGQAG